MTRLIPLKQITLANTGDDLVISGSIYTNNIYVSNSLAFAPSASIVSDVTISGSFNVNGTITGSGAGLTNIPASSIIGLNLSQISSGSYSASISQNGGMSVNTSITASGYSGSGAGLTNLPADTLSAPITFSIAAGKSLGKYAGGTVQTIGAAGWTIEQLMRDIALESLTPTAAITITSAQPEYNATNITNVVSSSYTINTYSATTASGYPILQYRRNVTDGWTTLATGQSGSYSHVNNAVTDKSSSFYYQYTVLDSAGAQKIVSSSITPKTYSSPTVNSSVTDTVELGNTTYSATKTITNPNPNVTLSTWQPVYQLNNGALVAVGSPISYTSTPTLTMTTGGSGTDGALNGTTVTGLKDATNVKLYARIVESSPVNGRTTNLQILDRTLEYKKYYGSTASAPVIRNLNQTSTSTTTFSWLAAGKVHTIAIPVGKTLTTVTTSNNETLTSNFVVGLVVGNVADYGGTNRSYNIYTYTTAVDFNVTITATTT